MQTRTQDQDAAPVDMSIEQMFLEMMQRSKRRSRSWLKMMSGQQALEKELEQQEKELEKEREERMRDEDWRRNIELSDIAGNDGHKAEEHHRQASRQAGHKRNTDRLTLDERAVQMEKDASEKELQEKKEAEKRQFEKVKDVSKIGMSKEDLQKKVQNKIKAQF